MKKRGRTYYHDNRERQLKLALIRRRRAYYEKREVINALKMVPCADCGKEYPYYVMDFDHRNTKEKLGDISHAMSWSIEKIKREVRKCDVVCANCHRIRTYGKNAELAKVVTAHV
ncbi:hypothetical protein HY405_00500 [Candidatus Microgenomates bacterium]|nr:hypothetical protein [Candidatus Microgenomates bacterium]